MANWYVVRTSRGQQQVYAPTAAQAATAVFQQTGETVAPPPEPGFPAQVAGVPVIAAGSGGSFADQWSGSGLASDQTQPTSGYQPSSGYTGSHNPFGQYTVGATPGSTEVQELFPEEAYQAGLRGAGFNPEGAFGGFLRNRFDPTLANFWANKALTQGRGESTAGFDDFQQYAGSTAGGRGGNIYDSARDYFRQIAGGANVGGLGESNEALRNVRVRGEDDPEAPGSAENRRRLATLARSAAFGQYGGWGSTLLPSDRSVQGEFDRRLYANTQAGVNDPNRGGLDWAAYLKERFGLR